MMQPGSQHRGLSQANALNISIRNSLWGPIYIINFVVKTKLPCKTPADKAPPFSWETHPILSKKSPTSLKNRCPSCWSNNTYFFSTLFLSKMDYRECNFGPSCTCDHRPTLVHGTSPNFSTPNVRGGEPLSLTSPSCTKKEHIDNNLRKKSRGEGL